MPLRNEQIKTINIRVSENKRERAFQNYVGEFHLRFVERMLNQMNLTKDAKIAVIDGIISNIKEKECSLNCT